MGCALTEHNQNVPKVLVVDDVQEIVEELTGLLSLLDIAAVGAQSLAQALAILEQQPAIRVVACDVRLHRESGLEIVGKVAASEALAHRNLHYIFITGDPMRSDAIEAGRHCRVLTKPVNPRELIQLVQDLLAQGETA